MFFSFHCHIHRSIQRIILARVLSSVMTNITAFDITFTMKIRITIWFYLIVPTESDTVNSAPLIIPSLSLIIRPIESVAEYIEY